MIYNFNEHKHRYAVWTAARAQRAFVNNKLIEEAINATSLRIFSETTKEVLSEKFDELHKEWCHAIMSFLDTLIPCSYGRAAKIAAIYLKTSVILPEKGSSPICEIIHPPIDSILLKALSKEYGLKELRTISWTAIGEAEYWVLAETIRRKNYPFNWKLETFWGYQNIK